MDVVTSLARLSLVPVVEIADAAAAVSLGRALLAGGLPCAEITFRTAAAADAIRRLRLGCPDVLVGAGTILTIEDADTAIAAGAAFLVAPGFYPAVVRHAAHRGVPMFPGVCTPTDIELALANGISVVKFFPAEATPSSPARARRGRSSTARRTARSP